MNSDRYRMIYHIAQVVKLYMYCPSGDIIQHKMYSCVWGQNVVTNRGQMFHYIPSVGKKEYVFMMHVKFSSSLPQIFSFTAEGLYDARISRRPRLHALFCWLNKTNLITPQSFGNHLSRAGANCQIWGGGNVRRGEAESRGLELESIEMYECVRGNLHATD